MKKTTVLLVFLIFSICAHSQKDKTSFQIGVGGLYNFQTEGKAADIRLMFPLTEGIYFTPRLSYFPSSNKVHEIYAGADIDYFLLLSRKITPYIYLGGYYDYWTNSNEFQNKLAKEDNVVYEGGGGLVFNFGCINPYIEGRYDAKWKEGSLGAGLMVRFGSCFGSKIPASQRCPHF
jgi:hypothetical protein